MILYLHGFGSSFNPNDAKITELSKFFEVDGVNLDYTRTAGELFYQLTEHCFLNNYEMLVGSGIGGYMAAVIGSKLNLPFVAINPSTEPTEDLKKYIGYGTNREGKHYNLTLKTVESYRGFNFPNSGRGLILLDEGDEFIDARKTYEMTKSYYNSIVYPGGSHRFDHMHIAAQDINTFKANSEFVC